MFGRRQKPPRGPAGNASNSPENKSEQTQQQDAQFPWSGSDYVPCNFAIGHLRENLIRNLTLDGRTHAETLMAALGCIAGRAVQMAVFARMQQDGKPIGPPTINVAETSDGRKFFFGDPLNDGLLSDVHAEMGGLAFWPLLAGGGIGAGLSAETLPQLGEMFAHIAGQVGADKVLLSVDEKHQPHVAPPELLDIVWPLADKCFRADLGDEIAQRHGATPMRYRPVITGYVANQYVGMVKEVLEPRLAITICMESAIFCSKIPVGTRE